MHRWRSRRTALRSILAFPALVLSLSTAAHAATFVWDAPKGCPDRDVIRWRVEDALGTKLENAAPLSFTAKVEHSSANSWVVVLDVASTQTESPPAAPATPAKSSPTSPGVAPDNSSVQHRTIEASNCEDLAQATGVAIALALGADLGEPAASPDPNSPKPAKNTQSVDAKPEPPTKATGAPSEAKTKIAKGSPFWLRGALGPVIDRGTLPGWAPGVEGAFSLGRAAFDARLGALVLPSESKEVSGNAGGSFAMFAATAAVCGGTRRSTTLLRLCLGTEFGKLTGTGVNVAVSWSRSSTWIAPRGDLDVSIPLGDASLRAFGRGTLVAPMIRKKFTVDGLGQVHQPDSVGARLGIGLELLWP
jgi:hypothetical protein